jgi:hypothetical protein
MGSRNVGRLLSYASVALIPIYIDVSTLIRLGKLSAWTSFAAEFLTLVTLLAALWYMAFADWSPLLSDQIQKRFVQYRHVSMGAIVTTNVLLNFVITLMLLS